MAHDNNRPDAAANHYSRAQDGDRVDPLDDEAALAWLAGHDLRLGLHRPARGVAGGQAAVLYEGDAVLGSGTISGITAVKPLAGIL